jgi:hypothetical protein
MIQFFVGSALMRRLHFLETSAESEKKPSDPGKTENEGIQRPRRKQINGLASSFSLTEKRFAKIWTCCRHKKFTNLTSAAKPVS